VDPGAAAGHKNRPEIAFGLDLDRADCAPIPFQIESGTQLCCRSHLI
jgi:hypothetical protein